MERGVKRNMHERADSWEIGSFSGTPGKQQARSCRFMKAGPQIPADAEPRQKNDLVEAAGTEPSRAT